MGKEVKQQGKNDKSQAPQRRLVWYFSKNFLLSPDYIKTERNYKKSMRIIIRAVPGQDKPFPDRKEGQDEASHENSD